MLQNNLKPAATAVFQVIMQMMDSINETTKAAYSDRKIAILFNIGMAVSNCKFEASTGFVIENTL
jgi:hypothetical protein